MNTTAMTESAGDTRAQGTRSPRLWVLLAWFVTLNAMYMFLPGWWVASVPFAYWAFAQHVEHRRLDELGGGGWAIVELLAGLAWGCFIVVVSVASGSGGHLDLAYLSTGLAAGVVFYAACEELIWRGLLVRQLDARIGSLWAIGISSVAFALAHGPLSPWAVVVYTVDGIVFGAAYLVTGRLWLSIGVHAAANLAVEVAFPGVVRFLPFVGLQLAAAVLLLILAHKRGRLHRRSSAGCRRARTAGAAEKVPH